MLGLACFDQLFPEIAEEEMRFIRIADHSTIPDGTYALREHYCLDPACDCRRLNFHVISLDTKATVASVSYGFDRDGDDAGPFLDPLNPQSRHAEALLDLVGESALQDRDYLARLERHYRLVKEAVADPAHPIHERIAEMEEWKEPGPIVREEPKVGRNEPCPCGSGKKYKKCCLGKVETPRVEMEPRAAFNASPPSTDDDYHAGANEDDGCDDDHDEHDDAEHDASCNYCGRELSEADLAKVRSPYTALKDDERRKRLGPERFPPSEVARLGAEEILSRLQELGVETSREAFARIAEGRASAWSIADEWARSLGRELSRRDLDFLGLAACELWRRFAAERPSQEMLEDGIDEGYTLFEAEERARACDRWWEVWQVLRARLSPEMRKLEQVAPVFPATVGLENWLLDFTSHLLDEAWDSPMHAALGVELLEGLTAAFPDESEDFHLGTRASLGEILFHARREAEGERVLRELIRDFPARAIGYVTLADALELRGKGDPAKLSAALAVLEEARKRVADVEEREQDVELRIAQLRERGAPAKR